MQDEGGYLVVPPAFAAGDSLPKAQPLLGVNGPHRPSYVEPSGFTLRRQPAQFLWATGVDLAARACRLAPSGGSLKSGETRLPGWVLL